jgi:hypothetical protein
MVEVLMITQAEAIIMASNAMRNIEIEARAALVARIAARLQLDDLTIEEVEAYTDIWDGEKIEAFHSLMDRADLVLAAAPAGARSTLTNSFHGDDDAEIRTAALAGGREVFGSEAALEIRNGYSIHLAYGTSGKRYAAAVTILCLAPRA